ncbi:MAG: glycoside hydrolase family 27 protein, partial [Thermoanaerobaculia bacterium]
AREVDDGKVRAAAEALVVTGLAAHGFSAVNIDDCWQGERDARGELRPSAKFPDMSALAAFVHARGLRFGIYSSPGPKTCTGHEGSYGHERQDAEMFARWGVDALKYDWCTYDEVAAPETGAARQQKPYRVMRAALDRLDRDILFSLCQYGVEEVWRWGAEVGGTSWRTSHDLNDSWGSLSGIAFPYDGREKFAGPGHWNDPDMLVVGRLGWGTKHHPTRLTPDEQVTHLSMWCLQAAPLLIGCDLTRLDPFTLRLLTNDEALDVDQDPLGQGASRKARDGSSEVWARPLWDGTTAVGLVNRGILPVDITATWKQLGLAGSQPVRDLWRRKTLGSFEHEFKARVPAHGTVLVKIGKSRSLDS